VKEEFLNINFEITNNCNQNCIYCYNTINTNFTPGNPLKTIKKLFEIAKFKQLTITGGEPTISENLLEIVVFAKLNGVKVVIITNASTNNQKLFSKLISAGVSHFQITINSVDPEVHNQMAATGHVFENSIKNIEYILKNGGKVIPSIVLTNQNSESLNSTFDFLKNYGFKTIIVNRYNISSGRYSKHLTLSTDLIRSSFLQIDKFAQKNDIKVTSNVCTPFCILNPYEYPNIQFGSCPDNPKQKPITVDYLGDVRLCNHSKIRVGNIFKNSLTEMLYSDYAMSWISQIPTFCIDCNEYDNCKGGCKAASEQLYNNHLIVDPIVEFNKAQPLTKAICNTGSSGSFNHTKYSQSVISY
jgi:radical SAM protein with 4Fe4S-binding SPASM domain